MRKGLKIKNIKKWNLQETQCGHPRPPPGVGSTLPHLFQCRTFTPPHPHPTSFSQAGGVKVILPVVGKPIKSIGWLVSDNGLGEAKMFVYLIFLNFFLNLQ